MIGGPCMENEILNEINKEEVYNDIKDWLDSRLNEKEN